MMKLDFVSYTDHENNYSIKLFKKQNENLWGFAVKFKNQPSLNSRLIASSDSREEALEKAQKYVSFFMENWLQ